LSKDTCGNSFTKLHNTIDYNVNFTPLKQLSDALEGSLLFDDLHKTIYATDASAYRIVPMAVALPKSDSDIVKLIHFANQHKIRLFQEQQELHWQDKQLAKV
jgi:hypothetical protein